MVHHPDCQHNNNIYIKIGLLQCDYETIKCPSIIIKCLSIIYLLCMRNIDRPSRP